MNNNKKDLESVIRMMNRIIQGKSISEINLAKVAVILRDNGIDITGQDFDQIKSEVENILKGVK